MAIRKYMTEFGLNMVSGLRALCQQDELHKIDATGIRPHIYIVGRRPRIVLDPNSVAFEESYITGTFRKQIQSGFEEIPFRTRNLLGTSDVVASCPYPGTEFEFLDRKSGAKISNGKCARLMGCMGPQHWHHLDLEVLYIGQSYGVDGARTATDRLLRHETLQGIYSEAIRRSPDQDIWLFLSEFEQVILTTMDGTEEHCEMTTEQDDAHIAEVLWNDITEQQKVNFTEAALIRYFQPKYNAIYKETFPNPAHKTYSQCYDIDLNAVTVELPTEDLRFRFWSDVVEPDWTHFCTFPLHSREERRFMFEF